MNQKSIGYIDLLAEFSTKLSREQLQARFRPFEEDTDEGLALQNAIVDLLASEFDLLFQQTLKIKLRLTSSARIQGGAAWPEYRKGWYRFCFEVVADDSDFKILRDAFDPTVIHALESRFKHSAAIFLKCRIDADAFSSIACGMHLLAL